MKKRLLGALALAAALLVSAVAASAGSSSPDRQTATKVVIWLQNDADSGWKQMVTSTNDAFKAKHRDVDVDVQYQSWGDHLTKFDAALAGGTAPDVIELGNTETTRYMASRLLQDLTTQTKSFPNYKTWLKRSRTRVPTTGASTACRTTRRARRHLPEGPVQGRRHQVDAEEPRRVPGRGQKLMKKYGKQRNYSALYFPGRYIWAGMAFVYDYGGKIAEFKNGKWKERSIPRRRLGLTKLKAIVRSLSRANKTGDEANPQQSEVFAKGRVGSFIGNGWEWPNALDKKVGNPSLASKIGAYPMPSRVKGKFMPTFLGGSDVAVPVTSKNKALAYDWIRIFTSNSAMRTLATVGKQIPNTTTLASINASNPQLAPFANASKSSWFVPTAPNWVKVENARVLQVLVQTIVTGKATVAKAAGASDQVTKILNSPTT